MPKLGRPTVFSAEKAATIVSALEDGCYLDQAAALAGVSRTTLQNWLLAGGRNGGAEFVKFNNDVRKAQAEAEHSGIRIIKAAAKAGQWQAAAWLLERKNPERWGRQDRVAIEHKVQESVDAALGVLEQKLTPEEYDRVLGALADFAPGETPADGEGKPVH
jgi:hypothetical protein